MRGEGDGRPMASPSHGVTHVMRKGRDAASRCACIHSSPAPYPGRPWCRPIQGALGAHRHGCLPGPAGLRSELRPPCPPRPCRGRPCSSLGLFCGFGFLSRYSLLRCCFHVLQLFLQAGLEAGGNYAAGSKFSSQALSFDDQSIYSFLKPAVPAAIVAASVLPPVVPAAVPPVVAS